MTQYISKSAIKAEINRRIKEHHSGYLVCLKEILSFINTLEVKEVDLEKELRDFVVGDIDDYDMGLAKHFYELGLKAAQKGE